MVEYKSKAEEAVKKIVKAASGDKSLYLGMQTRGEVCTITSDDLTNIENAIRTAYEQGFENGRRNDD